MITVLVHVPTYETEVREVLADATVRIVYAHTVAERQEALKKFFVQIVLTEQSEQLISLPHIEQGLVITTATVSCPHPYQRVTPEELSARLPKILSARPKSPKPVICVDAAMRAVVMMIDRLSSVDISVLLTGPSGTGKEVLAQRLHQVSARSKKPFIAVNCAAIPENMLEAFLFGYEKGAFTGATQSLPGKFEQAHQGILFLDEVAELPLALQAKLLRALQEQQVERLGSQKTLSLDVRVIAATNRCLQQEIAQGRFREDLYYRLSVFPVEIPTLKERRQDILVLFDFFVNQYAAKFKVHPRALTSAEADEIMAYDWPGNVRELENFSQRFLVAESTESSLQTLLGGALGSTATPKARYDFDSFDDVLCVLQKFHGSRVATAKYFNVTPRGLRYKLSKMKASGLEIPKSQNQESAL